MRKKRSLGDVIKEKAINHLTKKLRAMAKAKAASYIDKPLLDVAATKIVNAFADYLIRERALDYFILYGEPETLEEKQAASKYILGEDYVNYLAENSEKVKERFAEFLKIVNVRLSSMTIGDKNEN